MSITNLVSYELNGVKESFANWISNISPSDTPFTSMTGKESIKNKYFQWQEDALKGVSQNAFAEGSDATGGDLTPTTVQKNVTQILRKVVQVSDTANALANYGRGKELQYQMEKASKELKRDIEWALLNQVGAVEGTGSLNAGGQIGTGTSTPVYKPGESNAAAGAKWNSGNPALNAARRTAGFEGLVAPKGTHSPEDNNAIVHRDATTTGVLSEEDIFLVTSGLYLAGAKATHIMFHPKHAQVFSGLMEKAKGGAAVRIRMFDGAVDQKVNKYVNEMIDPLGQRFALIPNRFMPEDKVFFFNPKDWTQMVLRAPNPQLLAKTGSFDKYMIECELGLRHRNQFASGILVVGATSTVKTITGLTVGSAKAGATVPFNSLFKLSGGAVLGDYSYAITPAVTGATLDATTKDLKLAANVAVGSKITVVATAVTSGAVIQGNGEVTTTTAPDLSSIAVSTTASDTTGGAIAGGILTIANGTTGATVTIKPTPANAVLSPVTISGGTIVTIDTTGAVDGKLKLKASAVIASGSEENITITMGGKTTTLKVAVTAI